MEIIGLFCPAIVSLMVGHMLNDKKTWKMPKVLFEYGLYVLANALLSICVITYVLRMDGVTADAFRSFPFFTKYMLIALVLAFIAPYVTEVVTRYLKITFTVRDYDEEEKECTQTKNR